MKIEFWFTCILRSVALFIFVSSASLAQQYPVQATAAITPPYSVFLSDYAAADANPLQLHLFLRDLDRFEYRVKLRVRIEGPGITLTTRASYVPTPIVLSGGITNFLTGFDIRSYLHPDNLNFSGISKQQFAATGKLPEGFYTFSFEVLDYARGVVVSNIANATAFCVLNDPPIINLPFNNEKVVATDPQNMMFSWTPRHLASPNSAFNTEYEFRLVELYPSSRNPNDAIRAANAIFTVRTSMTSFSYGMNEPLLVPGRKYAFRVRAMDLSGRDLFKNNGYSEVYVFQFGDACVVPTQITGESLDANRIQIIWQESVVHTGYRVQYREKGTASWTTEPAYDNLMLISELKPNTEYEYQVKGVCGTIHGSFSNSNFLKTMNETEAAASNDFQCGTPSPVHELNPTPLDRPLKVDDVIWFGSTDIRITAIRSSAGGRMSGLGIRQVRMFNGAYAKVKLRNVLVNANMRVIDGYHSTAWNLESQPVHYEDPDKKEESRHNTSTAPPAFNGPTIQVNGDIVSIALDSIGHIIATFADGTSETIDRPEGAGSEKYGDVRLEDSTGEQWTVYRNDHISRQAPVTAPAVATNASQIDFTVQFVKNAEAFAGLDVPSQSSYGTRYNEFTLNGVRQKTAWKAFEQGRIDYVNAMATGKSEFPSIVGFTKAGVLLAATPSTKPEQKTLTIEGTGSYELKAYVPLATDTDTTNVEVGVLNAVMYSRIERMVHIVPVNGVQPPDPISVQAKLNEIYGQAVAGWTVVVEPDFEVETSYIVDLDKEESGALASYNQKCREFNKAYKKFATNVYRHDFYIFLISGSNSNRKGFMPFKRGFGYVFVDKPGDDIRAIAHELGHGAFNLQHPEVEFAKSDANNLMGSSGTGTELKKYQWDYVHDPQGMVGWIQGDDESASVVELPCLGWFDDCDDVLALLNTVRTARVDSKNVIIRKSQQAHEKIIEGENFRVGGVGYRKIKIVINVKPEDYVFDPKTYQSYNKEFLVASGQVDWQTGYAFYKDSEELFKILVYDTNDKITELGHFLFGIPTQQHESTLTTSTTSEMYVVFKGDANIRKKSEPYSLVSPEQYLTKGAEVELIRHLVDGSSPRALIKYLDDTTQYCTSTTNLMKIIRVNNNETFKLETESQGLKTPYSETVLQTISTKAFLFITHECGIYSRVSRKENNQLQDAGWVLTKNLRKYVDIGAMTVTEFRSRFATAAANAVDAIKKDWATEERACNLCVRAALYNLTGDDVLFPNEGSSITIKTWEEPIFYGKVNSSAGSAQGIIDDLKNGNLTEYFEEVTKLASETYPEYWARLQNMVDNGKAVIIGTYDPGHVFMIVPGGTWPVVSNKDRVKAGLHQSQTNILLGDQWGHSFAQRNLNHVVRILDCGKRVKFSNGPLYGVMDALPCIGEDTETVTFYKYIQQ